MELRPLTAVARSHLGLITLDQTRELGYSNDSWRYLHDCGVLEPVHHGVARVAGAPETRRQRILAALLAMGPDAIASHRTAAFIWGVERPDDDPIDVIAPRRRRPRMPGIVVHRPTDDDDLWAVQRGLFRVVPPVRMLLDLGAVDRRGVGPAIDHVVRARLLSLGAINAGLVRHARPGRAGVRPLRAALAQRTVDGQLTDSDLETLMLSVRQRFGLPSMAFHPRIAGYEVDFLVLGTNVVIECDGWTTHGLDRDQFEFDRLRDADLIAAGYVVVHVTWRQLTQAPAAFARRLTSVLDKLSGRFSGL